MQKPFIRQQIRLFILGICIVSFLIVFGRPTTAQSANSIERVSVGLNGAESNGNSNNGFQSSISADGRYVAFTSSASDLVNGATNGLTFVYVYDRQTKQMSQVSVPPAENETQMGSFLPSISADGRYVAFCRAGGYYNYAGCLDVYVHDMQTGQNTLASVTLDGQSQYYSRQDYPAISGDGNSVAFMSNATNLTTDNPNTCQTNGPNCPDVYVRNMGVARYEGMVKCRDDKMSSL